MASMISNDLLDITLTETAAGHGWSRGGNMRQEFLEDSLAMDTDLETNDEAKWGDCMTGIKLIDKYANYYYRQMRVDGYNVDREQVVSELSFVYAKALDRKNKGLFKAQHSGNDATASFKTYCARGFVNQINTLKRQLIEERDIKRVTLTFHDGLIWDPNGVMHDDAVIGKELEGEILGLFSGLRQAIAGELINPSQAIVDAIKRYNEACRIPENLLKGRTSGGLTKAIAEVYDISERKARYEIKIVKNSIKKLLTEMVQYNEFVLS